MIPWILISDPMDLDLRSSILISDPMDLDLGSVGIIDPVERSDGLIDLNQ